MHRLTLNPGLTRLVPRQPATFPTRTARVTTIPSLRTYANSAPKSAEQASAQSGGSRSKDVAEKEGKLDDSEPGPSAQGRTGGGDPLEASQNPPPRPKILNASVPGSGPNNLTKEQQDEVDRHNADFEKRPDRASAAEDDKVDKGFWKGQGGHGHNKNED